MKYLLIILGCGSLLACGQAMILSQDPNGGVLAVGGLTEQAMLQSAEEVMRAHCGRRGYRITARNTVVVRKEHYTRSTYKDQLKQDSNSRSEMKSSDSMNSGMNETDSWVDSATDMERADSDSMQSTAQGQEETVTGVRNIREHRITYRCGQ